MVLTFGSSIRLTPKQPCPATLELGHPQLVDENCQFTDLIQKTKFRMSKVGGTNLRLISSYP